MYPISNRIMRNSGMFSCEEGMGDEKDTADMKKILYILVISIDYF